jgi:hypothetical protein
MWERLRRFKALEGPARTLFLRAFALLPLISLSLRLRGFGKTRATLEQRLSAGHPRTVAPDTGGVALTVRMVRAAVRHGPGHPTCLEESLALWWLLGRQGITCDLRVGVRKQSERFEAHAWVEHNSIALNEPEALHEHYAAFASALASIPPEPR